MVGTRSALAALERSLAGSHARDSIVRKFSALIAGCHARMGNRVRAEEVVRAGRELPPGDVELMFVAAGHARERRDVRAAEALYRELIDGTDGDHFANVDAGPWAVKGRHNLALMLLDAGRGRRGPVPGNSGGPTTWPRPCTATRFWPPSGPRTRSASVERVPGVLPGG